LKRCSSAIFLLFLSPGQEVGRKGGKKKRKGSDTPALRTLLLFLSIRKRNGKKKGEKKEEGGSRGTTFEALRINASFLLSLEKKGGGKKEEGGKREKEKGKEKRRGKKKGRVLPASLVQNFSLLKREGGGKEKKKEKEEEGTRSETKYPQRLEVTGKGWEESSPSFLSIPGPRGGRREKE